jgi:hypothetical protein
MQRDNWKAIQDRQAVQLEDSDRVLLDKIQTCLALNDWEFLNFLILIGKIAPSVARLSTVHLIHS